MVLWINIWLVDMYPVCYISHNVVKFTIPNIFVYLRGVNSEILSNALESHISELVNNILEIV